MTPTLRSVSLERGTRRYRVITLVEVSCGFSVFETVGETRQWLATCRERYDAEALVDQLCSRPWTVRGESE